MPKFEFERGAEAKEKKKVVDKNDIARDFASKMAERETDKNVRGRKDAEAWKRSYWSYFEIFFWKKLEDMEQDKK